MTSGLTSFVSSQYAMEYVVADVFSYINMESVAKQWKSGQILLNGNTKKGGTTISVQT